MTILLKFTKGTRVYSLLLSLAGAPLKDWHDQGLKFWFEDIFSLVCEICQDFGGIAEISSDFLHIGNWSSA